MSDLASLAAPLAGDGALALLREATRQAGGRLGDVRLRAVHRRGDRSLSHVYEAALRVDDHERDVLLVAHVDVRGYPDGAFLLGPPTGGDAVAVWRFPYDPYLPGLPSAIDPGRVRELLDDLGAPAGAVRLRTRAYRPSRRAVVEVTVQGESLARVLYLKVFAGRRAEELADLHRQLQDHVPVPRVIGVAPRQGIVALAALSGRTLRQALVEASPVPAPEELVELSRRFAASGLRSRRDPIAFADARRHVAPLAQLVPELEADLTLVAAEVGRPGGEQVPVHGDLHDGQLLLADDGTVTGLLDVDGSGTGYLAQDAGNLVAHVQAIGEVWPDTRERVETYAAALTDAYRTLVPADELARAVAGAWLGLATGPHRAQDPGWREATVRRVRRAVASLPG